MKASIIFITLIIFNTTALVAEPVAKLIGDLNTWLLVAIEVALILAYCINTIVKDVRKAAEIELNGIDLFVTKSH